METYLTYRIGVLFYLIVLLPLLFSCGSSEKKNFMASGNELASRTLFAPAMAEYEEAIKENPQNAEAHYRIGALANEIGNTDFAARKFRDALTADANYSAAQHALATHHVNRGTIAKQQGRLHDAQTELLAAVQVDPGSETAYFQLGLTYEENGKLVEALDAYTLAARVDSRNVEVQFCMGRVYLALGEYALAESSFEAVLAMEPERADAHLALGKAYVPQGQGHKARAAFDQAIRHYLLQGERDSAIIVKRIKDASVSSTTP